ncbi:glmU [Acrasis kona]|uniref:GlmU n=1 Tax=Acrasis kona TaxID=1008807 RepID=A0AAW2YSB6_9EUKA
MNSYLMTCLVSAATSIATIALYSRFNGLVRSKISKWRGQKGTISCSTSTRFVTIRLVPGQDPYKELENFARENRISAATIVSCVGSLTKAHIRYANSTSFGNLLGFYEIVSLVGCISDQGQHIHICISDHEGKAFGGHLLEGNKVYTTAEITLAIHDDVVFERRPCPLSHWDELYIPE